MVSYLGCNVIRTPRSVEVTVYDVLLGLLCHKNSRSVEMMVYDLLTGL